MKLIWLFGQPSARATSQYWHNVKRGGEKYSFDRIINGGLPGHSSHSHYGYLYRSSYILQVENWLSHFNRGQFFFLKFEDLVEKTQNVRDSIYCFFELKDDKNISFDKAVVSHQTNISRVRLLQYLARQYLGLYTRSYNLVSNFNLKKVPGYPKMGSDTRKILDSYFSVPNFELERLTGLSLIEWKVEDI